jgi:acyl-CoA thioesterase FadM
MIGCLGKMGVTREISVRYLKPVPTNARIIVEGIIVKRDEKSTTLRTAIRSTDDVLLAESESYWVMASLSTIAKISKVDELRLREFLGRYQGTEGAN